MYGLVLTSAIRRASYCFEASNFAAADHKANVAKLSELVRNLRGALLHLAQLGFRSGQTSNRERNPAGAVAQFGILEPALVSGIVQS